MSITSGKALARARGQITAPQPWLSGEAPSLYNEHGSVISLELSSDTQSACSAHSFGNSSNGTKFWAMLSPRGCLTAPAAADSTGAGTRRRIARRACERGEDRVPADLGGIPNRNEARVRDGGPPLLSPLADHPALHVPDQFGSSRSGIPCASRVRRMAALREGGRGIDSGQSDSVSILIQRAAAASCTTATTSCSSSAPRARDLSSSGVIVEFGGGYGSMCRLLHKLGFSGQYFIYDLPEFVALQRYFLKSIGMPVRDGPPDDVTVGHSPFHRSGEPPEGDSCGAARSQKILHRHLVALRMPASPAGSFSASRRKLRLLPDRLSGHLLQSG